MQYTEDYLYENINYDSFNILNFFPPRIKITIASY